MTTMRRVIATALTLVLGYGFGVITGPAPGQAEPEPTPPAHCRVVSTSTRLIARTQGRAVLGPRILVTATTTKCGHDYTTRITWKPLPRNIYFR